MANDPRLITIRRDSFIEGEDGDRMYYALSDAFDKLNKLVQDTNIVNLPYPCITYRMVNDEAAGNQDPLGAGASDWEVANDTLLDGVVGDTDSVTVANGIFSFKTTGHYLVINNVGFRLLSTASGYIHTSIGETINNSTYSLHYVPVLFPVYNGIDSYGDGAGMAQVKITDIANQKIKLRQLISGGAGNTSFTRGLAGTYELTTLIFFKLAEI
jgi:hypothetical protein